MSNLGKTEKKIEKTKGKLKVLNEKREAILRNKEEENQKLPKDKVSVSKKERRRMEKEAQKHLEDTTPKDRQAEKVREIQYSYLKQNPLFYAKRKSLKEFIAPDFVDPNNYGYVKLSDAGRTTYLRNYYIDRMPRDTTFASTFSPLYNFDYTMSQTMIEPVASEKAIQMIDRQVVDLDTELAAATKDGNRNQYRKISEKMRDTEGWARDLEGGRNNLFNVTMLFQHYARTLEELNQRGEDFHTRALGKNMSVVSCYGCEPEAYKSGFPLNHLYKSVMGPIATTTAKTHQMDLYSLATLFNHTRTNFSHRNGVYLGRDLSTHRPITFDPYDPSLEAHNIIFCGKTGTGKSATIKMFLSRSASFGLKFCVVDSDARGRQGEYTILTRKLGGSVFQISAGSQEIVNLFEISEEMEYDENTGQEHAALHLVDKISIIKGIVMTMITYGKSKPTFEEATALESIIEDIIAYLYEVRGIQEGAPESLYASSAGSYSMVKKPLPTIRDFYIEALKRQKGNINEHHIKAYVILLDAMKSYVRELYYVPDVLKILTSEEYEALPFDEENHRYYEYTDGEGGKKKCGAVVIKGVRPYYDGQSTVKVDLDTPAVDLDVSMLPENDRIIGMIIATNFLNENFVKKNSANPRRLQKRAILIDEAHRTFDYPELRKFLTDLYRSARKRYISAITCTQSLSDYKLYEETREIVKQSPMIFLLRQDMQDQEYIKEATQMSSGQLERLVSLGGGTLADGSAAQKGQVCMIVNKQTLFVQIDYLQYTETDVVETNMQKIYEHNRKRRKKEYAKRDKEMDN